MSTSGLTLASELAVPFLHQKDSMLAFFPLGTYLDPLTPSSKP